MVPVRRHRPRHPLRLSGATRQQAHGDGTAFLENALAQYPFKVEKLLTDNGIEFSYNPLPDGKKPKAKEHPFVALCKAKQIEHRTTLVKHPWTNGMVEAMNKKVKANTTQRLP